MNLQSHTKSGKPRCQVTEIFPLENPSGTVQCQELAANPRTAPLYCHAHAGDFKKRANYPPFNGLQTVTPRSVLTRDYHWCQVIETNVDGKQIQCIAEATEGLDNVPLYCDWHAEEALGSDRSRRVTSWGPTGGNTAYEIPPPSPGSRGSDYYEMPPASRGSRSANNHYSLLESTPGHSHRSPRDRTSSRRTATRTESRQLMPPVSLSRHSNSSVGARNLRGHEDTAVNMTHRATSSGNEAGLTERSRYHSRTTRMDNERRR
jgi:hypothetical protein